MADFVRRARVLLTYVPGFGVAIAGIGLFVADEPKLAWAACALAGGIFYTELLHVVAAWAQS